MSRQRKTKPLYRLWLESLEDRWAPAAGILDPLFSNDGRLALDLNPVDDGVTPPMVMAIQGDGKVIVAGNATAGTYAGVQVFRVNTDGNLDMTFSPAISDPIYDGGDGMAWIGSNTTYLSDPEEIVIQTDGKIILVGNYSVVRLHPNGSIDTSFGTGGYVRTTTTAGGPLVSTSGHFYSAALQEDGKILLAGATSGTSLNSDMILARLNSDGTWDDQFGTGGFVVTHIDGGDVGYDVAIQKGSTPADFKIVMAGSTRTSVNGSFQRFAAVRYKPDGNLDTDFAGDGTFSADLVTGTNAEVAYAVVIQQNGGIVLAGSSGFSSTTDFMAARLNPDGILDRNFGVNGVGIYDLGVSSSIAYSAEVDETDRIVLGGWAYPQHFAVVRLTANGAWDPTFNGTGKIVTLAGESTSGQNNTVARDVGIRPDGSIVMSGRAYVNSAFEGSQIGTVYLTNNIALQVLQGIDGSPDTSFSSNGIGYYNRPRYSSDDGTAVAIQDDGKSVVVGSTGQFYGSYDDFAVARINQDGTPDKTFGEDGDVAIPFGNGSSSSSEDNASAVLIQGDKIIVIGSTNLQAVDEKMAIARVDAYGALDPNFGADGTGKVVINPTTGSDLLFAGALQGEKILVGGYTTIGGLRYSTVVRLDKDGLVDPTFASSGTWTQRVDTYSSYSEQVSAILVQEDEKIIVVQSGSSLYSASTVLRLTKDGALDTSFGTNGFQVYVPFSPTGVGTQKYSVFDLNTASLDADDGIVVAGIGQINGVTKDAFVGRLTRDGQRVSSFDGDGVKLFSISPGNDEPNGIAVQQNGRIVVSAQGGPATNKYDFGAARLNPDGSFDTTFGVGGVATFDLSGTAYGYPDPNSNDFARGMALEKGGNIVIVGQGTKVPGINAGATDLEVIRVIGDQLPTDIILTPASLLENAGAEALIGSLITTDPDVGDTHTYSLVSGPGSTNNSAFTIVGDQLKAVASFDYEATPTQTVRIRTTDQTGSYYEEAFTITVLNVNEAPVAIADAFTTDEDVALTAPANGVLANDTDPDGDWMVADLITAPAHGTLVLHPTGSFNYNPDQDWNGTDSFTYEARDTGGLVSSTVTVSIVVNPVEDLPEAAEAFHYVMEDTATTITLFGDDGDPELKQDLTFEIASEPIHGEITRLNPLTGEVRYQPAPNYYGPDSFNYRVSDGAGWSTTEKIMLLVSPVNDAPTATGESYAILEDKPFSLLAAGVLENDQDIDGDTLEAQLETEPLHGILELNPDGSFTYSPEEDWNGIDSFTYRAVDPDGLVSSAVTVQLEVQAFEDPAKAITQTTNTDEDVALSIQLTGDDGDPELDQPLTFGLRFMPEHGTLSGFNPATGAVTYTPNANWNGTDSFTFVVDDGNGWSEPGTVTVSVASVNDAPLIQNPRFFVGQNQTLTGADLFDMACDSHRGAPGEGNGPFTVQILTQPRDGKLEILPDGLVSYSPRIDFLGFDFVEYQIRDKNGGLSEPSIANFYVYPTVKDKADSLLLTPAEWDYSLGGVPDFDQRRGEGEINFNGTSLAVKGLPNNGNMYCQVTSTANWLAYLGNRGYPGAFSGTVVDWVPPASPLEYHPRYETVTGILEEMGKPGAFDISPTDGGGVSEDEMAQWLKERNLTKYFSYSNYGINSSEDVKAIVESSISGGLVNIVLGSYRTASFLLDTNPDQYGDLEGQPDGSFWRVGGHVVTLTGANIKNSDTTESILFRTNDPANAFQIFDGANENFFTQSDFFTAEYAIVKNENEFGKLDSKVTTANDGTEVETFIPKGPTVKRNLGLVVDYDSNENRSFFIDGYSVISAISAFSFDINSPFFEIISPIQLTAMNPPIDHFQSANNYNIKDALIVSNNIFHPYITENSDTVWRINQVTGESSPWVTGLDSPHRLAFGGPRLTTFVLDENSLAAIDRSGTVRHRITLPDSGIDAIAYDDFRGGLAAFSSESGTMYTFSDDLRIQSSTPLGVGIVPGAMGARTLFGIDPASGAYWLHKSGATALVKATVHAGSVESTQISVGRGCGNFIDLGVDDSENGGADGMTVDGNGHVLLTIGGRIAELDPNGNLVDSIFNGLPSGGLLSVSRGINTVDPGEMEGPSYVNVLPPVAPKVEAGPDTTSLEGVSITLNAVVDDPDEEITPSYFWQVTANNGQVISSGTNPSFNFTPIDSGIYTVKVTVTDSSFLKGFDTVVITVTNVAPTATFTNSGQVPEGTQTTVSFANPLDASGDLIAGLRYSFALNPLSLTSSFSESLPIPAASFTFADNGTYPVFGRVIDKDGSYSDYFTSITVTNVLQTIAITGIPEASVPVGTPIRFGSSVTDPGDDAPFTFAWSLNGGATLATEAGFTFTPTLVGPNTVSLSATDKDGVTVTTSASFTIAAPPPSNTAGVRLSTAGILEIVGTDRSDQVIVEHTKGGRRITVKASFPKRGADDDQDCNDKKDDHENDGNKVFHFDTRLVLSIRADLRGGKDHLNINDKILVPATVSGGPGDDQIQGGGGNDTLDGDDGNDQISGGDGHDLIRGGSGGDKLNGNSGDDVLLGGDGDDKLLGESGRDLLIGGTGADRIEGNQGDDILIGGYTSFDQQDHALIAIMTEWRSEKTYQERVENIRNGTGVTGGYGLNGKEGPLQTVFDDKDVDILTGNQGTDWFFANLGRGHRNPLDLLTDRKSGEWENDIDR